MIIVSYWCVIVYWDSSTIPLVDEETSIVYMRWTWNDHRNDRSEDTICYLIEGDPNIVLNIVSASSPNFLHTAICL
jgi:hypothetical protein